MDDITQDTNQDIIQDIDLDTDALWRVHALVTKACDALDHPGRLTVAELYRAGSVATDITSDPSCLTEIRDSIDKLLKRISPEWEPYDEHCTVIEALAPFELDGDTLTCRHYSSRDDMTTTRLWKDENGWRMDLLVYKAGIQHLHLEHTFGSLEEALGARAGIVNRVLS